MILQGDALTMLKTLPDESVQCCVTSPPYWGLRDYGTAKWEGGNSECNHISRPQTSYKAGSNQGALRDGPYKDICGKCGAVRVDSQLGLKKTPEEYVGKMVEVFREVKRVLRGDGTLWLNLGDSYAANNRWGGATNTDSKQWSNAGTREFQAPARIDHPTKPKDLVGIPWRVAFALQADGWYLRQDIIWHKPNPMPESVTDRCTKAHEYIFLMSKNAKYYYDQAAIKEPLQKASHVRLAQDVANQTGSERVPGKTNGPMKAVTFGGAKGRAYNPDPEDPNYRNGSEQWGRDYIPTPDMKANKKSVWTVTTRGYKEAHFATFPPDLITPCILAGCPESGTVLDPFFGAGTTGLVCSRLNREYVGIELNGEYVEMAKRRIEGDAPLLNCKECRDAS